MHNMHKIQRHWEYMQIKAWNKPNLKNIYGYTSWSACIMYVKYEDIESTYMHEVLQQWKHELNLSLSSEYT